MTRAARRSAIAVLAVALALAAAGVALAVATTGDVPAAVNEDATNAPITLTGTTDTGAGTVTWTVTGGPSHGSLDATSGTLTCDLGGSCSGDVHYTPTANYNGSDSFTYNVGDSDGASAQDGTVTITVNSVNDAPTGADNTVTTLEDQGHAFGTADFGFSDPLDSPPNSLLAVKITTLPAVGSLTDNGSGVAAGDVVPVADIAGGLLVFTPAANASGSGYASFTFQVQDDGGIANGGVDLDPTPRTMNVNVTAVNDAPSFTAGGDVTVDEDSGAYSAPWATDISPGPLESGQVVDFQLTTDTNSSLFAVEPAVAADGTLTFTPAANANGTATIGFTLHDDGGTANGGVDLSAEQTFTLTINPVNDPPTFTAGNDPTVNEDSGAYSAPWATDISPGPADESGQTVSFGVTGDDNAALFAVAPAVAADGTLTFTPEADANGVAHMTVTAHDSAGGDSGGSTLTITVTAVNDPPTFTPGPDEVVNQNTGAFTATGWATSVSPGPPDESSQAVTFSFTLDDNPTLFSAAPAVSADGTLTFTPAAGHSGTANLTLVAQDDGGTANGGIDTSPEIAVVIRVNANPNAVNDTATVPENSTGTVLNLLANDTSLPDPPETLTITGVSSGSILGPLHGTASVTGGGTTVTYKPVAGYYGSDFFRYTIADPYGATDYADVVVTIAKDTTPPTVTAPVLRIRTVTTMTSTSLAGTVSWSGRDAGVGISRYELQRSVNGGAYAGITLSSATATSVNLNYTMSSSVRFRVRATDRNGNVSGWAYSPTERPTRYEETSGSIAYGGTWYRVYNSNDSGLYAKYATVSGRSATFKHVMRDVAFVAPTSSGRGTVYIYVDGVKVKTLSLRTSTTLYRRVLWSWHFSNATPISHTIRIVVSGNVRVDLDCFVILS